MGAKEKKWRPDVFKITKDGVSLEDEGVRPSHDQFVQLSDYLILEDKIKEVENNNEE